MPTLKLNGKDVSFEPGETLLEVAWRNGVPIPVFCYHPHLPIKAACRMCLVEVEHRGRRGLLPSCATQAQEGMVVETETPKVQQARRDQLQFLLLNHPLECPVCDAGGECDLQNLTYRYGPTTSLYEFPKQEKERRYAGPFFELYPNRCITCYRCVTFYQEIAGSTDWGFENRGHEVLVGPYRDAVLESEFSGNLIEICPLGAITGRDYRFRARPWEMTHRPGISPHDSLGANLMVYLRLGGRDGRGHPVAGGIRGEDHEILRCYMLPNPDINDPWIDDRSRFVIDFLNTRDRLLYPRVVGLGEMTGEITYPEALDHLARRLRQIRETHGPESIGLIASGYGTNETAALLAYLFRDVLGTPHLDARPAWPDRSTRDALYDLLGVSASTGTQRQVEEAPFVLAYGLEVSNGFPLLGLRLIRRRKKGLESWLLTSRPNPYDNKYFTRVESVDPYRARGVLRNLVALLEGQEAEEDPLAQEVAKALQQHAEQALVIVDDLLPEAEQRLLLTAVALTGAQVLYLRSDPNGQGFVDAGVHPYLTAGQAPALTPGWSAFEMIRAAAEGKIKALVVFNRDLLQEFPHRSLVEQALKNLEFLAVLDSYLTDTAVQAHLILPLALPFEDGGTYTTADGILQGTEPHLSPLGASRRAHEVLLDLLDRFGARPQEPLEVWMRQRLPMYADHYPPTPEEVHHPYPTFIPSIHHLATERRFPRVSYPRVQPRLAPVEEEDMAPLEDGFYLVPSRHLYWTRYALRSELVKPLVPSHQLELPTALLKTLGLEGEKVLVRIHGQEYLARHNPMLPDNVILVIWPPLESKTYRLIHDAAVSTLPAEAIEVRVLK